MTTDRTSFAAAEHLLSTAVAARTFPAVVAEVGSSRDVTWQFSAGTLSFEPGAADVTPATLFDLASLTKPLATTSVVLQLLLEGRLRLDDRVTSFLAEWRGADRDAATIADLLEHASGLEARLLDSPPLDRRGFEHEICTMPLACEPRERSIYSDLGFIILGFIAEQSAARSLSAQAQALLDRAIAGDTGCAYPSELLTHVGPSERHRAAPTRPLPEDVRRGRRLAGEVHDNYAAALGGFAGHAGLFGTAGGVGRLARVILRAARGDASGPPPFTTALARRACTKSSVRGSSRALGWDTMLPTSSCGVRLSAAAFGHVGFTGTSLWIDPVLDRYFVLLANRVCDGGSSDDIQRIRRAFHDTVAYA